MDSKKQKSPRALIITMTALVLIATGIAWLYYKSVNDSIDPRIAEARILYEKYNEYALQSQYDSVFWLMDSIESIYLSVDHYKDSYETGVLYNNRAAAYLAICMQPETEAPVPDTGLLIEKAESAVLKSINIYERWNEPFKDKDEEWIREFIRKEFLSGLDNYDIKEKNKFLDKRVDEIIEAQNENFRRLSVSYSNLGMIKRYHHKYDSAAILYKKAIDLWDKNLTAENNLNILLNRPLRKRNILEKLFPPEK